MIWDFKRSGGNLTRVAQTVSGTAYQPFVGDFSGDGVDDIFWYQPGPGSDGIWDFNPDGSRTTRPASVSGTYRPVTGDFASDGIDDVFWHAPGSARDAMWWYEMPRSPALLTAKRPSR